ncbi:SGNH/GDSL hydrolase family protein [Sphingomonas arantia]|uniref:SGNH/GDSL hydrolase family protein n=1 Tax=Sphingomonas arantia TaxID=1460676 RepID=A0ABW4TWK2_9SPHN
MADATGTQDRARRRLPRGIGRGPMRVCLLFAAAWAATVSTGVSAAPPPRFTALGDSLSAGGYPDIVAARFGATMVNAGLGGQSTLQVAARYGTAPVTVVVAGGRLMPGANALTTIAPELLRSSNKDARTMPARIAGVSGTLLRAVDAAGADRTSFVPDPGQKLPRPIPNGTRITVGADTTRYDLLLLCVGRNGGTADPDRFMALVDAIIALARSRADHIVLLGIPNAADPGEARGTPGYDRIVALNRRLAERYPDLFLDIRAAYNRAGDPRRADDRADMARDTPPRSLRADHIHYNPAGARIWADAVTEHIRRKGWFQGGKP